MILYIGNNKPQDANTYAVPYSWLIDKSVHLYIASNKWEKLVIDISEDIPSDCLKYIAMKCASIHVNLPDRKLSQKELELLCELFSDKAGAIRKAYMLGRDLEAIINI